MSETAANTAVDQQPEVTSIIVWPSVAGMSLLGAPVGRTLGQLFAIETGAYIFTVGNLFCLLCIPIALVLYFKRIGPFVATRYRLTNKRIIVERGLTCQEDRYVDLDRFDSIAVEVLPGQQWYHAGDLVFLNGSVETFRLPAVSRPEAFRQICLKARNSYVGVKKILQHASVA